MSTPGIRAGTPDNGLTGPVTEASARGSGLAPGGALRFVVLLGIVSLFADMTYEGARSITGPYLAVLGASGAAVGIVAGGGELLGYALRMWSGWLADRTGRYWAITLSGYAINLLAVPCLALAGNWPAAAVLIVLERAGKAIRTSIAMAVDGLAALAFGRLFDRQGIVVLVGATALSMFFAPLAFFGGFALAVAAAALWGVGMGAQESIMRAAVAEMTPIDRRGTAFGLFNMLFGVLWFAGSALMGWLYDVSVAALVVFSVAAQLTAIPFFLVSARQLGGARDIG